jgi:hypothetical protein
MPDAPIRPWVGQERPPVRRCQTCALPDVAAAAREFLDDLIAGKTRWTLRMLHEWLVAEFDYRPTYHGLLSHLRRCLADTYAKAKETGALRRGR